MTTFSGADIAAISQLLRRTVRAGARLAGGEHAVTTLVSDGTDEYVVRRFPPGDPAVSHEVRVLDRLAGLGELAPRLVAHDEDPAGPIIITNRVAGTTPAPDLAPMVIAREMARALARIHALNGTGLRAAPASPPRGTSPIVARALQDWAHLDRRAPVLTHYDFWCGNALWQGGTLSGVVDWSGARHAPRGLDVSWCRLDLVLLGDHHAADAFLTEYRQQTGQAVVDIAVWDRQAAAHADPVVESWSPNYAGIGRPQLTGELLRQRLDNWITRLLTSIS